MCPLDPTIKDYFGYLPKVHVFMPRLPKYDDYELLRDFTQSPQIHAMSLLDLEVQIHFGSSRFDSLNSQCTTHSEFTITSVPSISMALGPLAIWASGVSNINWD
jgi:hypothetical protein